MISPVRFVAASLLGCFLMFSVGARAAEVTVLCSVALETVLREAVPPYEKATGDRVIVTYASSAPLKARIDGGAAFDVAVLTPGMIADLVTGGVVDGVSVRTVAVANVGIAVRSGAVLPDISTAAAMKAALLAAPSVASSVAGQSRVGFLAALKTLGIVDEVNAKTKIISVGSTGEAVARGEAAIAVQLMPELLAVVGLDVVGPFPAELQMPVVLTGGVRCGAAGAAGAFVAYLGTPEVARVIRAKGMEPG